MTACTCITTFEARLNGDDVEPCAIHAVDELAARRAARARRAPDDAEEAALAQLDPLVAALHRITGAPAPRQIVPTDTPIGDDETFAKALADLCGGSFNSTDPTFPDAA